MPLVTLDDRTADGQTDAQPIRFGRVERLKQLFNAAWILADARVANQQLDAVGALDLRLDSQRSRPALDAGHRISGIQQQVRHHRLFYICLSPQLDNAKVLQLGELEWPS